MSSVPPLSDPTASAAPSPCTIRHLSASPFNPPATTKSRSGPPHPFHDRFIVPIITDYPTYLIFLHSTLVRHAEYKLAHVRRGTVPSYFAYREADLQDDVDDYFRKAHTCTPPGYKRWTKILAEGKWRCRQSIQSMARFRAGMSEEELLAAEASLKSVKEALERDKKALETQGWLDRKQGRHLWEDLP